MRPIGRPRTPANSDRLSRSRTISSPLRPIPFSKRPSGRNRIAGIALNYGWKVKYSLNDTLAVRVEGFGLIENLGASLFSAEQQHRLGPALFATIKLGEHLTITPDVGLFFGLTDATPSLTLKLNVGVPLIEPSAGK